MTYSMHFIRSHIIRLVPHIAAMLSVDVGSTDALTLCIVFLSYFVMDLHVLSWIVKGV